MYGTVARMRLKQGAEPLVQAWLDGMANAIRDKGWVSTTLYRSDEDPQVFWMAVMFESKEAYHANAESPHQGERFQRLRSCLEEDPEWNDGEVWAHRT